jgi:hypothetical protein
MAEVVEHSNGEETGTVKLWEYLPSFVSTSSEWKSALGFLA